MMVRIISECFSVWRRYSFWRAFSVTVRILTHCVLCSSQPVGPPTRAPLLPPESHTNTVYIVYIKWETRDNFSLAVTIININGTNYVSSRQFPNLIKYLKIPNYKSTCELLSVQNYNISNIWSLDPLKLKQSFGHSRTK